MKIEQNKIDEILKTGHPIDFIGFFINNLLPEVNLKLEKLRCENKIGKSLDAKLKIIAHPNKEKLISQPFFKVWTPQIIEICKVSELECIPNDFVDGFEIEVESLIDDPTRRKCPRCWHYHTNIFGWQNNTGEIICKRCEKALGADFKYEEYGLKNLTSL